MDFLTSKIKPMYFKYLTAAFGSALISSIYGVVDMAMVGQYQGPNGTAALAVVAPIWNIIYSLGLLMGIGGSVLFSTLRGRSKDNQKESNEYFTAAVIGVVFLAVIAWIGILFFDTNLLKLFGAKETLLPLSRSYLFPVKFVVPSFLFTQLMAAFLRNDGNPGLATKAVLSGGVFNIRRLFLCVHSGHGNHGRRTCHRYGFRIFSVDDADPFPKQKEYPATGKADKAAFQTENDQCDRFFHIFY